MPAQADKLRAWASLNGAAEVQFFEDAGLSGGRADNRPGLVAALATVGQGDVLVVYSLSRLARSTKDAITIAEHLAVREAHLVSLSEKLDTTSAAGRMFFRLMAVLGEFEADLTAERTRAALSRLRADGKKTGGDTAPYGFRVEGGHLIPDPEEQEALGLIRRLHRRGRSLRTIARRLEARGFKTKRGLTRWHPKIVSDIIARAIRDERMAA